MRKNSLKSRGIMIIIWIRKKTKYHHLFCLPISAWANKIRMINNYLMIGIFSESGSTSTSCNIARKRIGRRSSSSSCRRRAISHKQSKPLLQDWDSARKNQKTCCSKILMTNCGNTSTFFVPEVMSTNFSHNPTPRGLSKITIRTWFWRKTQMEPFAKTSWSY